MDTHQIEAVAAEYPARLRERLAADAPLKLTALGNLNLLASPKTALFCSARCPGNVILRAYDQAAQWRDADRLQQRRHGLCNGPLKENRDDPL